MAITIAKNQLSFSIFIGSNKRTREQDDCVVGRKHIVTIMSVQLR